MNEVWRVICWIWPLGIPGQSRILSWGLEI